MNDEAYEKINSVLNSYDWEAKLSNKNIDDCFEEWHSTVQSTINKIAPEKEGQIIQKTTKACTMDHSQPPKELHKAEKAI